MSRLIVEDAGPSVVEMLSEEGVEALRQGRDPLEGCVSLWGITWRGPAELDPWQLDLLEAMEAIRSSPNHVKQQLPRLYLPPALAALARQQGYDLIEDTEKLPEE